MMNMTSKYQIQSTANISSLRFAKEYKVRTNVLNQLHSEFSEAGVEWAIACSCALFLMGVVDNFHDFDLLVAPKSFDTVCSILERIGHRKNYDKDPSRQSCFCSKFFAEFEVDGIDIDVICEFGFTTFDTSYQYHFNTSELQHIPVGDLNLPVIAAEAQYVFYAMMTGWQAQRAFKRDLIAEYLLSGNVSKKCILENVVRDEVLPPHIMMGITNILEAVK